MTQVKHLQDYIYPQIKCKVEEKRMHKRYIDIIQKRLDNDEYLWDQIKEAIDYAIEGEARYNKNYALFKKYFKN